MKCIKNSFIISLSSLSLFWSQRANKALQTSEQFRIHGLFALMPEQDGVQNSHQSHHKFHYHTSLLTSALMFHHLCQMSALKTAAPWRFDLRWSDWLFPVFLFHLQLIYYWLMKALLSPPKADRSYRVVPSVLMAYLCTNINGTQMHLWAYECMHACVMCACLRICEGVYSSVCVCAHGYLDTCSHYILSIVFMYFPGCLVQAAVGGREMLGFRPVETMPDGLISLCGCERERGCVFAITMFTELLTLCKCVYSFTSIIEFWTLRVRIFLESEEIMARAHFFRQFSQCSDLF